MKVTYDREVDAVYLELLKLKPEGVIEVGEGINIDVTFDGRIVGDRIARCYGKGFRRQFLKLRD